MRLVWRVNEIGMGVYNIFSLSARTALNSFTIISACACICVLMPVISARCNVCDMSNSTCAGIFAKCVSLRARFPPTAQTYPARDLF